MDQIFVETTGGAAGSHPSRLPQAIAVSLGVHAVAILVIGIAPSPPRQSVSLRSGAAASELRASLSVPPPPEPMSVIEPIEATRTEPETGSHSQSVERRLSKLRRRVASDRPVSSPPPVPSLEVVDPSPRAAALPARQDVAEPQPLTRPRRQAKRRPPPPPTVAAVAVPAAEIAGAERETPTPLESNRPPRYPAAAIARGVEGTTVLRVTVGDDGSVVRLEVQDSSGSTVLDRAAMSAVALWRFRPQPAGGKGGTQAVRIPVRFRLDR